MSERPESLTKSLEATKVQYRRLGKSGLRISVPVLGAMSFGHKEWQQWVIEEDEAFALLKAAYDRGKSGRQQSTLVSHFSVGL